MIESIPQWVLDWSGSILTMIGLYFYVFNNRTAWHWGNAGQIPYTILFWATGMWMLLALQICFIIFNLHGYILWWLQDNRHWFVKHWKGLTTPVAAVVLGVAWWATEFSDAWVYIQFLVVAFSVVASWGLARRFAWSWLVWLPANFLGFFYYMHSELWSLMIIQIPLFAFSVYGYWEWTSGGVSKRGIVPKDIKAVNLSQA